MTLVDNRLKWIEVKLMINGNAVKATILKRKEIFCIFGLPVELVSDHPFNATEFLMFFQANGIKIVNSSPYHPQSNGLSDNGVQKVKKSLKKKFLPGWFNNSK